jgi:putative sterol carrier protein
MAEEQLPTTGIQDVDADQLAQLVAAAGDEQIAEGMADPEARKATLDDIFRRMAEHVDADKAAGKNAVVHFKILDRPDGGYDHYEVVIENGQISTTDQPQRDPQVTLRIGPVDFVKLVSGNANGPMLFMGGKLKIEGDLMFAAGMTSLFRIPKAAPSA